MTQNSTYHRMLRVSSLLCALVLAFQSGIVSEYTALLTENTQNYLANSIGMSASVQPTELNQYTAALTQKERELEAREQALRDREINVGLSRGEGATRDVTTYILASILFVLLVLILLNYVLDYLRAKERELSQTV